MLFRDAFRAQYYLRMLQQGSERLSNSLDGLKNHFSELETFPIIDRVSLQLADQLDQMLLPTIAYEIARTKATTILAGTTPETRYDSFFMRDNMWTSEARSLPQAYPFLFEMLQNFVSSSFDNLCYCVEMLTQDIILIRERLLNYDNSSLTDIYILGSDRHRNGKQAILLTFASGAKIVFKPTDLMPDLLFARFVSSLALPGLYNLRCMRAVPRKDYGWLEYITSTQCSSFHEIGSYFRRAGVLLAITDVLNYCDGHFDNLIAAGPYPVLIDCETLFHAFGKTDPELGERSILFTGLIQKPPKADSGRGFTAALQTPGIRRFEFLHTYAINDHTDDLTIRYRGISNVVSSNCPVFEGHFQTPHDFIDEFVDGFITAYDHISNQTERILHDLDWWQSVSVVRARQLVRHTLYYFLLIRKIQQPDKAIKQSAAVDLLRALLRSKTSSLEKLVDYEISNLLRQDIPFFYHYPGNCNLYDGDEICYPNYFGQSAIAEIHQNFKERSLIYRDRSVDILRNILPASPRNHVSETQIREENGERS